MNNDMQLLENCNDENDMDVMRNALILIAEEIQSLGLIDHRAKHILNTDDKSNKFFSTLNNCSAKVRTKNKQLRKLKENLKIACDVAKIVLSAKNRETEILVNHLNTVRNESSDISNNNTQNVNLIKELKMENYKINNEMHLLSSFIHLGYERVQKLRNEIPKNVPSILELKTILLACGQYYADYCNEQERNDELERQNRFLNSKLSILASHLAATAEELHDLRNRNIRLKVKCDVNHRIEGEKARNLMIQRSNVSETLLLDHQQCEEFKIADPCSAATYKYDQQSKISRKDLNLTLHLDTVNNLLSKQDDMLNELKGLYQEMISTDL